jgi:Tol biopolymer transport system component
MIRLRFLLPLAAAIVAAVSAFAADKRPITHEDIWLAKRLTGPAVSSDGRWTAVRVTDPAYDEKKQSQDIWLVANDGRTPPRQLTFNPANETGLAWSPDGTRLAFSSKRDGDEAAQIYVLDVAQGGEARRVTSLSNGAREPQWSPDGTKLLFLSTAYPTATDDTLQQKLAADKKARKAKVRTYEGFPIRYWDKWLDEQQTHVFVQDVAPGSVARNLLAGTALAKNPGFGGRQTDTAEELDAVWAPDGHQ